MAIADLKVGTRLGVGFSLVATLMLIMMMIGISRMADLDHRIEKIVNDRYPKVMIAKDVEGSLNSIARYMRNTLIFTDASTVKKEIEKIGEERKTIVEALAKLEKTIHSDEGKQKLKGIMDARAAYLPVQENFMKLIDEGKKADATNLLLTQLRPAQLAYFDNIEKLVQFQDHLMTQAGEEALDEYTAARNLMLILGFSALVIAAFVAFYITRGITRPLNQAVGLANAVTAGDLTRQIEVKSEDETGQLMRALKSMNENLADVVGKVREGSDAVGSAAKQISMGNSDLSQRTQEQASALEETASSMEQMTSTVKQNADNARQANQLAAGAREQAEKGGEVVAKAVSAMDEINSSSKKIADIIGVIDEIAFQTNLLALNAAVEAARAGEQGRGFAVVAGEVRNLAQRSSGAAKEIKDLINDSVDKVKAGSRLVDESGKTLAEIMGSVKKVSDIVAEIAAASQEQSVGIEQVNKAITQMDEVTQQNAALVEEAAAASQSMEQQAAGLNEMMAFFKLTGTGGARARTTSSAHYSAERTSAAAKKPGNAMRPLSKPRAVPATANAAAPAASKGGGEEQWNEF